MVCPLCNSESKFAFAAKGFDLHDCVKCSHRFTAISADETHVAEVYGDEYFSGGGAGYSDYLQEGEMLTKRGRMYAKILEKYSGKKGKMLDVGAAAGFLLKGFVNENWNGTGLEPNAEMAGFGREKLNLDIKQGSLEEFETNEKFDLISMIQVAAHFYEPRKAFEKAFDLLNENGFLLIETWNRESLSARIFGRNWHEYSPPSVLQFFSEKGLTDFLETLGFAKIARGRPSKKISGAHAKSLLKYRLGDNFLLKLIPGNLNFPYPSEDLFWALYQKK
ncbi:MAG: class I SAM-dependent methyltransferase [Pyrinomonadaceae bacterium]|nr:class I SAM-dependent methyltransferase [Pyrinomonadaceae bacterium]